MTNIPLLFNDNAVRRGGGGVELEEEEDEEEEFCLHETGSKNHLRPV